MNNSIDNLFINIIKTFKKRLYLFIFLIFVLFCVNIIYILISSQQTNEKYIFKFVAYDMYSNLNSKLSQFLHINNQLVVAGDTTFSDDVVVNFGTGNDLQIYHTSSTNRSYIKEVGSGGFYLQAANLNVMNPAGNETMLRAIPDGAVELYHNNIKKLETTAIGFKIYDDDATTA